MLTMQDLQAKIDLLRIYLAGIWHNKRYIMVTMWIICLTGFAAVATMPNQYKSTTKIFADTKSILKPLLQGLTVQGDTDQEIQVIARTLLSRPNLEDIARQTDLDIDNPTEQQYDAMLDNLKDKIKVSGSTRENRYELAYTSTDPDMAKKVVSVTMQIFVDSMVGQNKIESDGATVFLQQQVDEYEAKLKNAENVLSLFKQENQDRLPSNNASYYQRVSQINDEIETINLSIAERKAALFEAKKRLSPSKSSNDEISEPDQVVSTRFDERIEQLETQLDGLRVKYTDKHPNIIELKGLIGTLKNSQKEAQKEILAQASRGAITSGLGEKNAAIQSFSLNISALSSEIIVLETRKEKLNQKLQGLKDKLTLIPSIEAKLVDLNREYNSTNKTYQELLARLQSAELSRKTEENTSEVKFRVLEPPRVPTQPDGPARVVFYTAVMFLSVMAGSALAFFVSQLSTVVSSPLHLKSLISPEQFLGQVEHLEGNKRRRRLHFKSLIFFLTTGVLVTIYLGFVMHDIYYGQSPLIWLK
jgi:polysaccharide chain length determinant protein (PEP-CTERM system associated)